MSEMGFDAAADWRSEQAAGERELESQLAAPNPHTAEMDLAPGLLEDGGL